MTLLPDVERELLRVARRPMPHDQPSRRRRYYSGAVMVAFALAAVALAGIFLVALHRGTAPRPSVAPAGSFPGAPATQPGAWAGAVHLCPRAAPNRYLPPRSGCVTVVRADVDGDGRPDLVLLYGRLSHQRHGNLFVPTSFTLKVFRASGGVAAAPVSAPGVDPTILEVGDVNDEPGAELFVLVQHISSGASADVYSFHAGRLIGAGPSLAFGGDSASQAGFSCQAGQPPTIVQHTFVLERGGENGFWPRTNVTYAWHGATLRQVKTRTSMTHGFPPASAIGLGVGCGTLTPQGRLQSPSFPRPPAARCLASDLRLSLGPQISPMTEEHADLLVLRNASSQACTVRGYPKLTLGYAAGTLPFAYHDGGGPYVTAAKPRTVVLSPGDRAYLLVAKSTCVGRVARAANRITITMPSSAATLTVALTSPGASELDYCQGRSRDPGDSVTVSPVERSQASLS
jgi:hypothetical protein